MFIGRKRIQISKGDRYSKLTATGENIKRGHNILWECICDCGNITYVIASDLKRGHTTSCGKCFEKAYQTGLNYLYGNYKRGAELRNLSFSLSKEEFNKIITQQCYYCGSQPKQIIYKPGMQLPFLYNGIDRIDNSKGYEVGNVISACKFCNMAKGQNSLEEFEEWIENLITFRTKNRQK